MNYFYFLFFFFFSLQGYSQNAFKAGLIGGFNAAQIDGDNDAGYNKPGAIAGLFVKTDFTTTLSAQLEMTYINKGSRNIPGKGSSYFWIIRLNYIEIPVLLQYNYKKIKLDIGASYARLINQTFIVTGSKITPSNQEFFYKNEIAGFIGLNYAISKKMDLNLRYSRSILPVRGYTQVIPRFGIFGGSYNSILMLSLRYHFFSPT